MDTPEVSQFISELEMLLKRYGLKLQSSIEGDVDLVDEQTGKLIGWWSGEVSSDNFESPSS